MVVDPAGPALDLEVPLEIVIGTIPLQNIYGVYHSGPAPQAVMPMPGAPYDPSIAPTALPMVPAGAAAEPSANARKYLYMHLMTYFWLIWLFPSSICEEAVFVALVMTYCGAKSDSLSAQLTA